jgi:hypothetical protein
MGLQKLITQHLTMLGICHAIHLMPMILSQLVLTSYLASGFFDLIIKHLKRTGSQDRSQIFRQKWIVLGLDRNLYWILTF